LSTETLQRPLHGFELGVQQVPASALQMAPLAQSPLSPQFTGCMQLSSVCPHCCVPHGSGRGTHPHVLLVHVSPPSHVVPQSNITPQLSGNVPQRPVHQVGSCWQPQLPVVMSHIRLDGQLFVHCRRVPQLSMPVAQCVVQ
jgi:hypothetical protein